LKTSICYPFAANEFLFFSASIQSCDLALRYTGGKRFKHIEEVCVEIRDTFKWRTGNSSVPDVARAPDETVRDGWQEVDGDSELYLEVACYVELRRQLPYYEFFVSSICEDKSSSINIPPRLESLTELT
jgi:hypothetical protein